ncbi:MAG: hypothetical protein J0M05_05335 [Candidatus Kapabacteria bacterium]|nr:hypothetical protein [Candidatus Kapabacteria bacterium]
MKVRLFSLLAALCFLAFTSGCDTISNITDIKLPLTFSGNPKVTNERADQESWDGIDLDTISGYKENKDKIDENGSEIQTMSVSITNFDSDDVAIRDCVFENVTFWLKYDSQYGDQTLYPLGTYTNVKAEDYFKTPKTVAVDKEKVNAALKFIKTRPKFRIYQQYGKVKNFAADNQPVFRDLTTNVQVTILVKGDL